MRKGRNRKAKKENPFQHLLQVLHALQQVDRSKIIGFNAKIVKQCTE